MTFQRKMSLHFQKYKDNKKKSFIAGAQGWGKGMFKWSTDEF